MKNPLLLLMNVFTTIKDLALQYLLDLLKLFVMSADLVLSNALFFFFLPKYYKDDTTAKSLCDVEKLALVDNQSPPSSLCIVSTMTSVFIIAE